MEDNTLSLVKEFEQRHTPAEREALARQLLDQALLEVVCAECGRYALTLRRGQTSGAFECPGCHKRTFVVLNEGRYDLFSETRLVRLIRYASGKHWFCPDHEGTRVKIVRIQGNPADPRAVTLHYVCRRGWWPFSRPRIHSGSIAVNLLTLEMEMLASEV